MLEKIVRVVARFIVNNLLLMTKNTSLIKIFVKLYKHFHPYLDNNTSSILGRLNKTPFLDDFTLKITNTGLIQVYTKDILYLHSGGERAKWALEKSYNTFSLLKNSKDPTLVDYYFELSSELGIYKVEYLKPLSVNEYQKAVSYVLNALSNQGDVELSKVKNLESITSTLSERFNLDFTFLISKYNLSTLNLSTGYSHGDLTPSNIMKNSKNNFVLIDLDRFSFSRELCFDEIHFNVESSQNSKNWLVVLKDKLKAIELENSDINKSEISIYILYFIRRLSLEFEGDIYPVKSYRKKILSFISQL